MSSLVVVVVVKMKLMPYIKHWSSYRQVLTTHV
jgi:hypothetical protein